MNNDDFRARLRAELELWLLAGAALALNLFVIWWSIGGPYLLDPPAAP